MGGGGEVGGVGQRQRLISGTRDWPEIHEAGAESRGDEGKSCKFCFL